ncbi:MAG: glycoside hydrolase family 127 protein, partial [Kiritimatiellae bacterium]|nr:glycoside hydrolase family 127 protein [Kiritimatiellia bacterium]
MNTCGNTLTPVAPGDARLLGRTGAAADACLRARAYSDWARGPMYGECVDSFRTHWDDTNPDGPGWQNEYWGKTMLCLAGAVAYTHDPELRDWVLERAHEFIAQFQQPNGYLSTYSREDFLRNNPENPDARSHWCFNIWGRKYTLWALVELHRATGDTDCLAAAVRMADHLIAQLSRLGLSLDKTGAWHGISSMSILRPLLELHRLTGTECYRALARDIVRAMNPDPDVPSSPATLIRDAFRDAPIHTRYPLPTFWAKAYEILSCLEGLVEYHRVTGEKRVLDAVLAWHGRIVREELNPMGSAGYFDHFLNAAARVNGMTELCDVVHWIRLNRELLLVTGEPRYADFIEEAFLNAFLAGVSRDGRWGAHIVRSHGTRHLAAPPQTGMALHQCCPDNMMRTYFDYAASQVARAADGALCVLLYTDGAVALGADRVEVSGGYPWADGPVTVKATLAAPCKIRFRVPRWVHEGLEVEGQRSKVEGQRSKVENWLEVEGRAGENAWLLRFDLAPRLVEWTATAPEALPPSPQDGNETLPEYTVHFMEWMTPDMAGLCRTEPATRVLRGPL